MLEGKAGRVVGCMERCRQLMGSRRKYMNYG